MLCRIIAIPLDLVVESGMRLELRGKRVDGRGTKETDGKKKGSREKGDRDRGTHKTKKKEKKYTKTEAKTGRKGGDE